MFFLSLFFLGAVAGFTGAWIGIGGGMIITPVLTLVFHLSIAEAILVSLIAVATTSSTVIISRICHRDFDLRLSSFLEPIAVLGGVLGSVLSQHTDPKHLRHLFAFACLLIALLLFRRSQRSMLIRGAQRSFYGFLQMRQLVGMAGVSLVVGTMSGLLGIGGGILMVPMLLFMGAPSSLATSTSSYLMSTTVSVASVLHAQHTALPVPYVLPIVLSSIAGVYLHRQVNRFLPQNVDKVMAIVLLIVALKMGMT